MNATQIARMITHAAANNRGLIVSPSPNLGTHVPYGGTWTTVPASTLDIVAGSDETAADVMAWVYAAWPDIDAPTRPSLRYVRVVPADDGGATVYAIDWIAPMNNRRS